MPPRAKAAQSHQAIRGDHVASRTRSHKDTKRANEEPVREDAPAPKKAKVGKDGHPAPKKDADRKEIPSTSKRNGKASTSTATTKSLTSEEDGILERGHIYFFYRPKVSIGPEDTCTSLDDIAKFYFLMRPRDAGEKTRLFVIGKKRLPDRDHGGNEVFWATLTSAGEKFDAGEVLGEKSYSTKTRGERHIEPARIAGRGHYALFSPHPNTPCARTTHLVYFLTHPAPGELEGIQSELGVHSSGSFILQIKNPKASNPPQAGLPSHKKADYPHDMVEEKFGGDADHGSGKRFIAPNPASVLDFEGTEMLMIPEKHSAEEVLQDEDGEKDLEHAASKDAKKMSSQSVLKELRLDEESFPCDALEGDWL